MSLLTDPTVSDSSSVLTSPVVDPYSLNGGSGTDVSQSSSGECYDSSCSVITTCISVDPVIITDPIPVDHPISFGVFSLDGGLSSPEGVSLDGVYQVLQDGTSLASGWSADNSPVLIDYNAAGSVNTAFGSNGELTGPTGATWLLVNQTDSGAIQIQGSVLNPDGSSSSFLEQFTASGQVDTSFGGGSGSLTAPDGVTFNGSFTRLSNGDILAGSTSTDGNNTPTVVDYTSSGVVNNGFGNNGEIVAPAGVTSEWFYQDATTGDVVISDSTSATDGSSTLVGTYYTIDGQVDTSNSAASYTLTLSPYIAVDPIAVVDPIVITDPILVEAPIRLISFDGGLTPPDGVILDGGYQVLQDGTTLASAWSTDGSSSPVLVDYNADGSINTAFGSNGELTGPTGATWLLANQTDSGAIQIQGSVLNPDGSSSSFLEQFTASGQVDTSFGGGSGSLTAPDGVTFNGSFTTLSNGDILAGSTSTDGNNTSVVVDYTSTGVVNSAFGNNGEIIAPAGVTAEWFYQDSITGDVVITDFTAATDGSSTLVSTYYTTDGQVDPANPVVTSTASSYSPVDTVPVVAPVVMYNMAGGVTDRTVTLVHNVAGSTTEVAETAQSSSVATVTNTEVDSVPVSVPVVMYDRAGDVVDRTVSVTPDLVGSTPVASEATKRLSVGTVSNSGASSNADSYVISAPPVSNAVPSAEVTTSSSVTTQVSIISDQSTTSSHAQVFNSAPSGIAGVSALKLAAAAASNVSKGSTGEDAGDFVAASDSLDLALPVSLKEGFSLPKKAAKTEDPNVPEASTANKPQSEEDLISALLVEA